MSQPLDHSSTFIFILSSVLIISGFNAADRQPEVKNRIILSFSTTVYLVWSCVLGPLDYS